MASLRKQFFAKYRFHHRTVLTTVRNKLFYCNLCTQPERSQNNPQSSPYVGVVGLEVHAQINLKSKLFSRSAVEFASSTNTKVSFFDAALPGTLPVLNKDCVEAAILTALACNCTIHKVSTFDRKHYFYPDLPSGYQITQQFKPIASNGYIKFIVQDGQGKAEPYEHCGYLKQLQLEQDSGKSLHVKEEKSLVDLNRAGIGLMELVFEPNLKNGIEAASLVRELITILKRLNTCSCHMEEGSLRVDANISVHKSGEPLGVRTEVKNINSLRYIARAIDFEIARQINIIESGGIVINETRGYDFAKKCTIFLRDKEMLQDYRFMPEPNLPPIRLCDESDKSTFDDLDNIPNIDEVKERLPILPESERNELFEKYHLPLHIASKVVSVEGLKEVFESLASRSNRYESIHHFILHNLEYALNQKNVSLIESGLSMEQIADTFELVTYNKISRPTANDVLEMLINGDQRTAHEIVEKYNWFLITDEKELEELCLQILPRYSRVEKKYFRLGQKRYMNSLVNAVNNRVNNRACLSATEAVFHRLIHERAKKNEKVKTEE